MSTTSDMGLVYPPTMPPMSKMARLTGLKRRRAEFDAEINHLEQEMIPAAKCIQGFVLSKLVRNKLIRVIKATRIQEKIAMIEEEKRAMMKKMEDSKAALMSELGELCGEDKENEEVINNELKESNTGKKKYWGEKRIIVKDKVDEYIEKNGGLTATDAFELEKSVIGDLTLTTTASGLWGGSASGTNPRRNAMLEWGYNWVIIPKNVSVNVGANKKWWSK